MNLEKEYIWINGEILEISKAGISVKDRGFSLGDGLFETLKVENKEVKFLKLHILRLKSSLSQLSMSINVEFNILKDAINNLIKVNNVKDGSIRITISRGMSLRGILIQNDSIPTIVITSSKGSPPAYPVKCYVSSYIINDMSPISGIKTLNYLENILALKEANDNGFDEAIMLNTKGHVVSTTVGNIFGIYNGVVFTPNIASGCLSGIIRSMIIEICEFNNIRLIEDSFTLNDFLKSDALFLTNSLVGVKKISKINGKDFFIDNSILRFLTEKIIN